MSLFNRISAILSEFMQPRLQLSGNKKDELYVFETGRRGNITASGNTVDGKRQGLWKYFDSYGRLVIEEHYDDGQLEGLFISYYISGNILAIGNYTCNKRNGEFLIFNQDGSLKERRIYRDGSLGEEPGERISEHH
jgi:antitoxin component YwqK of YwqJK toxin-antitoxin module